MGSSGRSFSINLQEIPKSFRSYYWSVFLECTIYNIRKQLNSARKFPDNEIDSVIILWRFLLRDVMRKIKVNPQIIRFIWHVSLDWIQCWHCSPYFPDVHWRAVMPQFTQRINVRGIASKIFFVTEKRRLSGERPVKEFCDLSEIQFASTSTSFCENDILINKDVQLTEVVKWGQY